MKRFPISRSVLTISAVAVLMTGVAACSSLSSRKPASLPQAIDIPKDLNAGLLELHGYLQGGGLTRANCASFLGEVFTSLNQIKPEHFDREAVRRDTPAIVRNLFQVRLALRNSLSRMLAEGQVDETCVTALRDGMRAARFIDEYLAERITQEPNKVSFTGGFPYVQVNPAFGSPDAPVAIRSGDVLLSRGWAFTSAAIARVGEVDGQFSHLAIAYVDERTDKTYVVEAHIEIGVAVTTWEKYAADGKMRAVIFRHPDAALAHQAAKIAFEKASKASARGTNIPYDFGMDLSDDSELFCSEVPYLGFRVASSGQLELPLFLSRMSMKNRQFLDAIGVKTEWTFAPSDMEVDPRLELVAEWRNLGLTADVRRKDAVLTKMFEWMDDREYRLRNTAYQTVVRETAFRLRRWPVFDRLLEKQFPLNMNKATLGVIFSLYSVVDPIVAELAKADAARVARSGYGMTFQEMALFLEDLREKDFELYRNHRIWEDMNPVPSDTTQPEPPHSLFHESFAPPGIRK